MRIVIDLQGAQTTGSRKRGIGRYSLALAQGLARNCGEHEVLLALNGLFPETIEPIRAAFRDVLPLENIRVWVPPGPVAFLDPANDSRRDAAECLREAFLASLEPDIVLVTSLFEGLVDDAASSVGRHAHLPTAVVLYDLIPLIHRQIYLSSPTAESWYMDRLKHLKRADLLLSISASSGREAVELLVVDQARVVNISTACEPHFLPRPVTAETRRRLQSAYGIEHSFVMYTGGIDPRKNIEGLVRAYARLPAELRPAHQLVIVCAAQAPERERLLQLAGATGLTQGELVLTGYVPDDDLVTLYNACKLFVFPSWHEGFGLPALEAMQCGKAVIAANTSSLPEVVGRSDALFDPHDEADMAARLRQILEDEDLRQALERHGLEQSRKFSWDASARRALAAMGRLHTDRQRSISLAGPPQSRPEKRPLLAYVSPLPPEKSGIADYSAELLRELACWYEVEVVVDQFAVADDWIVKQCAVRDAAWFRAHHRRYDRVLYHFGNSPFHRHMFDLLAEIPGAVVLHDFFLSGIQAHREWMGWTPNAWARALQASHGYNALRERYKAFDTDDVGWAYPCNLPVLQQALGVIVHSEFPRMMAKAWYGEAVARDWQVIPLLRAPADGASRQAARQALGFRPADFLVCSFGVLGPIKLNQRLFDAFVQSPLTQDASIHLAFVGENHPDTYGQQLLDSIHASGLQNRVRITGWVNTETFRQYLAAADLAIQLRTLSRGETSAAVLDCMNHGLATVVNAHGSLVELDPEAVWMLPDAFENAELSEALTTLWRDTDRRLALGRRAQVLIRSRHAPDKCAAQYAEAIECIYKKATQKGLGLLNRWADHPPKGMDDTLLARTLALNFPPEPRRQQLLVDVSTLAQVDAGTGIQRVTRAILREWLLHPPKGWSVEPVYATPHVSGYRYARRFTSRFLGLNEAWAEDAPADFWAGDMFIGLDLVAHLVPQQEAFLSELRACDVTIVFIVHDLLAVLRPNWFPNDLHPHFPPWLRTIGRMADVLACGSQATLEDMRAWLDSEQPQRQGPLRLGYSHHGADIENSAPSTGMPIDAGKILLRLQERNTFLMVGTVEPRKGYTQTLAAFERLWARGHKINLVIVGKQGWMVEELVQRLSHHPELGRLLFWLQGISDEYLERVYAASTCLIAASEAEGFGLPLIEAARHRLPIIARDIPVFREVAGEHAFYFKGEWPEEMAEAVQRWLALHAEERAPKSDGLPWLTWEQSAKVLASMIMDAKHPQWVSEWIPGRRWYLPATDARFASQTGRRSAIGVHSQGTEGWLLYGPYVAVPAGDYELLLYGHAQTLGDAWVDVCANRGETVLAKVPLQSHGVSGEQGAELVRFMFSIERDLQDLEIRVWATEESILTVTRVEFSRCD
ncbi:MAG: glycosyltransferase [Selenomonadales bacterium]|nr:glycosyltransferase [Selenomonadales bacterium]